MSFVVLFQIISSFVRCGNVAAILELGENLQKDFKIFVAAPQVSLFLLWIDMIS